MSETEESAALGVNVYLQNDQLMRIGLFVGMAVLISLVVHVLLQKLLME
jgi:hypothetical protein